MGDGALLLGVGLGGEDDVGGLGRGVARSSRPRARCARGAAPRPSRARRAGRGPGRRCTRMHAVELAVEQAALDLLEAAAGAASRRSPGPSAGQAADLAQAAAVGAVGHHDQRRRRRPQQSSASAISSSEPSAAAPSRPRPMPSPQITSVLPGRSSPAMRSASTPHARLVGRRVPSPSSAASAARNAAAVAGQVAGGLLGAAVERGRAVGGDHQPRAASGAPPCAAAGRGSASRCSGSAPSSRIDSASSMSAIEAPIAGAESAREPAPSSSSVDGHVRRAERLADDPLDEVAPPRWRPAPPTIAATCRAPARELRRPRPRAPRSQPARLPPSARLGDPLLGGDHLEAEAALVAEPAVVDLVVVAGQDALDALVADGELDVALARAEGADRARVLDVPGPGAEAVGLGGQRPDRAELDDVAVEGRDVGAVVEGADVARARRARAAGAARPRRPPG